MAPHTRTIMTLAILLILVAQVRDDEATPSQLHRTVCARAEARSTSRHIWGTRWKPDSDFVTTWLPETTSIRDVSPHLATNFDA